MVTDATMDAPPQNSCKNVKVTLSVVIYCLAAAAVPIYNKEVFSGGVGGHNGLKKYPYPIATAFIQLGLVAVVCGLGSVLEKGVSLRRKRLNGGDKSWLFGPHILYKLRHIALVGLLFGFKYGITNWGLQLLPTGTHVLLQSTDLVWTVLVARIWNKERPGILELVAAVLSTAGSVLIGLHAGQTLDAPFVPLLVNCLTPLVLALCIATLRSGAEELFRPDNVLQGSMTATEFTAIKLFLSAFVALILSLILESGLFKKQSWWDALGEQTFEGVVFLLLGGAFVLIFQVNITWLTGLTSAVTVGVVGGLKVVPQWGLNAVFQLNVDLTPANVGGASLVLFGSVLYTIAITSPKELRFREDSGHRKICGLTWEPRLNEVSAAAAQRPSSNLSLASPLTSWRASSPH